jgi:TRAP-type transport system periplasmic protein
MICSSEMLKNWRGHVRSAGRRRSSRWPSSVGLMLAVVGFFTAAPAGAGTAPVRARYELKLATLAPEGSTWMNIMEELDQQIRTSTQGEVGLRWYPGGIQGDELVVLRKIRSGQLQGGGMTGVGLGEIAPSLRVLELPFLFRDESEVRAVHTVMDPFFESKLHDAGYTLLGWAEVGFVYLYSKEPVASTADLKNQKMWLWEGDPLAEAFLKAAGVSPVPLAITDVLTSLQTGLITAVYITPLANIAMQWFTRVSCYTDIPLSFSMGAVVVTNDAYAKIPAQYQDVVHDLCRTYFAKLTEASGADNVKSTGVLTKQGISPVAVPPAEAEAFRQMGRKVWTGLVGKLYDQSTLDQVLSVLDEHRSSGANPAKPAGGAAGKK